jgi:hypothetical protein
VVRLKPTLITLRYTIFLLTLGIKQWLSNIMQYSGSVVAGLCLLSPAIMKLRHKDDSNIQLDVLLEPGTFYIQRYHLNALQFMLSSSTNGWSVTSGTQFDMHLRTKLRWTIRRGEAMKFIEAGVSLYYLE